MSSEASRTWTTIPVPQEVLDNLKEWETAPEPQVLSDYAPEGEAFSLHPSEDGSGNWTAELPAGVLQPDTPYRSASAPPLPVDDPSYRTSHCFSLPLNPTSAFAAHSSLVTSFRLSMNKEAGEIFRRDPYARASDYDSKW